MDRELLRVIAERFDGGPVGLETLGAAVSEESDTIMDVYEPYLLKIGFLQRTSRGRLLTRLGYDHLGIEAPRDIRSGGLGPQVALFGDDHFDENS
jgi:Holliday junction DNA helicase RuvB